MEYETTVDIEAPPEKVWAIVQDVERWSEWTESISSIELLGTGDLAMGSRARVKQPGFPAAEWEVTRFSPGTSFAWTSKAPGLTSFGDHEVVPTATGSKVTLTFRQSGLVAPVVGLLMGSRARRYVDTEARGLKNRAEGGG